jgi:two-component system NtrC family sensor kinase
VLCLLDHRKITLSQENLKLIEIFSEYLAYEIERGKLENQLLQAQSMKVLGQLTAGVAHEVRNPLNAILAVTEALFQHIGDNPDYKPYIVHIREQVQRLSALMTDLLELGRPINKEKLTNIPVAVVVKGVMSSWQHSPYAERCNVQLIEPSRARKWKIKADSTKIQQVFFNLLLNSAQHSPDHSEIRFAITEPIDHTIVLKVSDHGSGIPPEHINRVFEPFFTTRKGGTGLGLSIVRHIVEMHGGSISLYNNVPPPGLTVEVRLPFVEHES